MTKTICPISTDFSPLRVFPAAAEDDFVSEDLNQQLPFLDTLCRQFEEVTGWEVGFQAEPAHVAGKTVCGQLCITDMSARLPDGATALHRQQCDQLVETLDELLAVIQDDRQMLDEGTVNLAPVVDLPFDWWSCAGSAGYRRGQLADWAITDRETIRLLGGRITGQCAIAQTTTAAATLATFAAAAQTDLSLEHSAGLAVEAALRASPGQADVQWLACIELDPVTGEISIAGDRATDGVVLIDTDAQTVCQFNEFSGTLNSGLILVLGDSVNANMPKFDQAIRQRELTRAGVADLVELMFAGEPVLIIYRS